MATRKTTPATKQDLRLLEQQLMRRIDVKFEERDARLIKHFERAIDKAITTSQQEILRHFDLTVETIRHDLLGANADEVASLADRVNRLERHVGLTPA